MSHSNDREHIEFIQSQVVPWTPYPDMSGLDYKLLSEDKKSGALTGVFRYPQGWQNSDAHFLNGDEEFFVLSGTLIINNCVYSEGYYGYFPARYKRNSIKAQSDTVVIRFIDGPARPVIINESGEPCVPDKDAITGINTYAMHWDKGVHDDKLLHLDFGRKILRIDPQNKAKTFLYMVSPQTFPEHYQGPREHHPTPEEAFMLHGTLAGHLGVMRTGAYFWRPPEVPHGPFGSRTGCVLLIRFVGGEHINHWSEKNYPFTFDPDYTPVLPDSMEGVVKDEWRPEPF